MTKICKAALTAVWLITGGGAAIVVSGCGGFAAEDIINSMQDSTNRMKLVIGLADVLASEQFCGLNYDEAAIRAFIDKNAPADDMTFNNALELITAGSRRENQRLSASEKVAHCEQIVRVAKSYGFTH
jgi:hypothetical protein